MAKTKGPEKKNRYPDEFKIRAVQFIRGVGRLAVEEVLLVGK